MRLLCYMTRAAVAWAAGAALLRSDDGGLTWRDTERGRFSGVAFADRTVGWIVDSVTVYGTDDGGRSWEDRYPDVPGGAPRLFDVAALDARHVVAVGHNVTLGTERHTTPAIVYSDDAAATWQRAVLPDFAPSRVDGIPVTDHRSRGKVACRSRRGAPCPCAARPTKQPRPATSSTASTKRPTATTSTE